MANNLQNLSPEKRQVLANSPELLNIMVAAYGERDDLLAYVRSAETVHDAKARAKEAQAELGDPPAHNATVDHVYAKTDSKASGGLGAGGESFTCKEGQRWDPITQTCVPIGTTEI